MLNAKMHILLYDGQDFVFKIVVPVLSMLRTFQQEYWGTRPISAMHFHNFGSFHDFRRNEMFSTCANWSYLSLSQTINSQNTVITCLAEVAGEGQRARAVVYMVGHGHTRATVVTGIVHPQANLHHCVIRGIMDSLVKSWLNIYNWFVICDSMNNTCSSIWV